MIKCVDCPELLNVDEEGVLVECRITGKRMFLDDLPWGAMNGCPKVSMEADNG